MTRTPIATIKLAPGRVGFYDEYSRIHLTLSSPTATVYSGTNCAQLRRSVKAHVIEVIAGSLGEEVAPFKVVKENGKLKLVSNAAEAKKPVIAPTEAPKTVEVKTPAEEPKTVPEASEEPVEEAKTAPEVSEDPVEEKEVKKEEVVEEVKEEKPKKKATKKKKAE